MAAVQYPGDRASRSQSATKCTTTHDKTSDFIPGFKPKPLKR